MGTATADSLDVLLRLRLGAAGCSLSGDAACASASVALPSAVTAVEVGAVGCFTALGVTCPLLSAAVAGSGAAAGFLDLLRLRLGPGACSPSGDAASASVREVLPSAVAAVEVGVTCPLMGTAAALDAASGELAVLEVLRRLRVRAGG